MRSFVVIGRTAVASPRFSLDDLAGSSGRIDVLVRCIRAALLISHGVRTDAEIFLVLSGSPRGERAPRTVRIRGATAKFLRPEERALATLLQKALASDADANGAGFCELRHGVSIARGGLDVVLHELAGRPLYVLAEDEIDVRGSALADDLVLVLGDHTGLDDATLAMLRARGASFVSLGPVSLHTDDAICVMHNELDRRREPR